MKVRAIYKKYKTPTNLQEHMLRVAALGTLILEKWIGSAVDTQSIIQTLLFHDIAKPITFDISKQVQFVSNPEELLKTQECINYLITNYGTEEHSAALKIFQEIGLGKNAQRLINNLQWHNLDRLTKSGDIESLITIYCDMRIGPKGILIITERNLELNGRSPINNLDQRLESARLLEKLISENLSIDPNSITHDMINIRASELTQKEII